MTIEDQSLSLVLTQTVAPEQTVIIDPLSERQRICFDNISSEQNELTLSFRRANGIWRDGFIHFYLMRLSDQGSGTDKDLLHLGS